MQKANNQRPHIGIFGRRNMGKSSLINVIAKQDIAIVSEIPGTTTDPVRKTMEVAGLGSVVFIDTAGIDDYGTLGDKRVSKSFKEIKTIDLAILLISENVFSEAEEMIVTELHKQDVPFIIVHNKSDIVSLHPSLKKQLVEKFHCDIFEMCAIKNERLNLFIEMLRRNIPETAYHSKSLLGGILKQGDLVVLITPIDSEAPEGRLILPQVQAIRDILDNDCIAVVVKEREIDHLMSRLVPSPALVITDSQVFLKADAAIPKNIPLTSFSIMLAHQKGNFSHYLSGTPVIGKLKDNDKILLLESCSHHVSCDDIGRVKIPRWMDNFTGKKLIYDIVSGLDDLPRSINDYALVVQCGGCMITNKQLTNRLKQAIDAGVAVTNYGMAIAYMHGIYNRAVAPFSEIQNDDYL